MRPPVTVTNKDAKGRVAPGWYVKVGNQGKRFTEAEWIQGGLAWISDMLRLAGKK